MRERSQKTGESLKNKRNEKDSKEGEDEKDSKGLVAVLGSGRTIRGDETVKGLFRGKKTGDAAGFEILPRAGRGGGRQPVRINLRVGFEVDLKFVLVQK